jgi:hypothetical protein
MIRSGFAAALFLLLASAAHAQTVTLPRTPQSMVGFYGGASIDPEQTYVGVFFQTRPIANRFHFRPGIDGGFGNDLRVATFNIDFIARFPLGASGWDLIQGGGPVIVLTKFDGFDGTETSAGGSYVFGFAHRSGFFGEFRIGGGGSPNLKMGAGYGLKF